MGLADAGVTNSSRFILAISIEGIDGDVVREHQKQEQRDPFLHWFNSCSKPPPNQGNPLIFREL